MITRTSNSDFFFLHCTVSSIVSSTVSSVVYIYTLYIVYLMLPSSQMATIKQYYLDCRQQNKSTKH